MEQSEGPMDTVASTPEGPPFHKNVCFFVNFSSTAHFFICGPVLKAPIVSVMGRSLSLLRGTYIPLLFLSTPGHYSGKVSLTLCLSFTVPNKKMATAI